MWDVAKALYRGKFIAFNTFARKKETVDKPTLKIQEENTNDLSPKKSGIQKL